MIAVTEPLCVIEPRDCGYALCVSFCPRGEYLAVLCGVGRLDLFRRCDGAWGKESWSGEEEEAAKSLANDDAGGTASGEVDTTPHGTTPTPQPVAAAATGM